MELLVRIVNADAERQCLRLRLERLQLMCAFNERCGTVCQHQTRFQLQCVVQDFDDVLDDKRFTAGENETLNTERDRFVQVYFHIRESESLQSRIAWLRALKTKRTLQIASSASVQPELAEARDGDGSVLHHRPSADRSRRPSCSG